MAKVLYIKANPKPVEGSFGLILGEEFIKNYREENPEDEIVTLDLYSMDIPEIDSDLLFVFDSLKKGVSYAQLPEEARKKFERYSQLTDQFVAADKYIFVTPLWNLGLPPRVKTYVDTFCVAGKTFMYTEKGPQGLLKDKKCLHIHASGSIHSNDPTNHADQYLKDIINFIGIKEYGILLVEGHNQFPDKAANILEEAKAKIPEFVKWFS